MHTLQICSYTDVEDRICEPDDADVFTMLEIYTGYTFNGSNSLSFCVRHTCVDPDNKPVTQGIRQGTGSLTTPREGDRLDFMKALRNPALKAQVADLFAGSPRYQKLVADLISVRLAD